MAVHCNRPRTQPETPAERRNWWCQTRCPIVRASGPVDKVHQIERGTQSLFGRGKNVQEEESPLQDTQTRSQSEVVLIGRTRDGKVPTGNQQQVLKQSGIVASGRHWGIRPSRIGSKQSCRCLASQTPESTDPWHWLGTRCQRYHRGRCDERSSKTKLTRMKMHRGYVRAKGPSG